MRVVKLSNVYKLNALRGFASVVGMWVIGCGATRFEAAPQSSEASAESAGAADSTNPADTPPSLSIPTSSDVAATAPATPSDASTDVGTGAVLDSGLSDGVTGLMAESPDAGTDAHAATSGSVGSTPSAATLESVVPNSDDSHRLDASLDTNSDTVNWDAGAPTERDAAARSDVSDVETTEPHDTTVCNSGEFDAPQLVLGIGYDDHLWGPAISSDANVLLFGYTDANEDLYMATMVPGETGRFENVAPLTSLNTGGSEGTPFLSYDALTLYFYATREGGPGDRDLWFATRAGERDDFGEPQQVLGLNGGSYDHLPWLSDDELRIYYTTERAGGLGRSDLWMATRASKGGAFAEPVLVPGINSSHREDAIAFSPNRLTVYFTTDRDTDGNLDIWRATRSSRGDDFSNPEVVPGLNSDSEDTNLALTRDGKRLYFSSGRDGKQRLWVAARTCP